MGRKDVAIIFCSPFEKSFAAKRAGTAWTCSFYKAACLPVALNVQVSQTKGGPRCGTPQASSDVLAVTFLGVLLNGSGVTLCSPSDCGGYKVFFISRTEA